MGENGDPGMRGTMGDLAKLKGDMRGPGGDCGELNMPG